MLDIEGNTIHTEREGRWKELSFFICNVFVLFCFWPHCEACRVLFPWPGMELLPLAVKVQSLNHWTAGEFPRDIFLAWWMNKKGQHKRVVEGCSQDQNLLHDLAGYMIWSLPASGLVLYFWTPQPLSRSILPPHLCLAPHSCCPL